MAVLATALVFFALRGLQGDAALGISSREGVPADAESLAKLRAALGMDRPLVVQYGRWLRGLATLDLGNSWRDNSRVWDAFRSGAGVSLELAALSLAFSLLMAVPLGVLSALFKEAWPDYLLRGFMYAGLALPGFWAGIIVVLALSAWFDYFPFARYAPLFRDPLGNLQQFALPALVLGWRAAAVTGRMVRSALLETLGEDYVRTARAKGLAGRDVVLGHALRNAALPVVTVIGFQAAHLIGGVVVIEQVFNLPGLGRQLVQGIEARDLPTVQALLMFFVVVAIAVNLAVDLLYGLLDPRVRLR